MSLQDRFDFLMTTRDRRDCRELLGLLKIKKLVTRDQFYKLLEKARAEKNEAALEGVHICRRILNQEVRVADGERAAKMAREGIQPTRTNVPTTGVEVFGKNGLPNVVIDGLLPQLEKLGYHLFGFCLEIKSQRNTPGEAKDARRQGRENAKPGGFKKTRRGGQALMYGFRFMFFRNSAVRQPKLYQHLVGLAETKVFAYGRAFQNDDSDHVSLVYKFVPPNLQQVTRILRDEKGFYAKTIPNNEFGIAQPNDRRASLMATLAEQLRTKHNKTG